MQPAFLHSFVTRSHKGVYGIIRKNNQILVIRKARGPYTGLYDLPGGSPEANETPEQTVAREIKEETNCDLISCTNKREKTIFFSQFTKASAETGCLQHTGILFDVKVVGEPTTQGDGLDSNGAKWVDIDTLSDQNATPFVLIGCGKDVISLANESDYPVDTMMRSNLAPFPVNRCAMVAGVFLFNSKGNIILQKIALTKKTDAGKWSYSAAGHVDAGESYETAALRELNEEMGICTSKLTFVDKNCVIMDGRIRSFHHVFKVVSDDKITFDTKEVADIREFTIPELKQEITNHPENFKPIFARIFMKAYCSD
ncbi:MAG: NUDIX domain-containing protein [Alphaproteobacteria bacterium]|nr:NUDIX domain-containing protein [Alphaproteobacteria bacterium]